MYDHFVLGAASMDPKSNGKVSILALVYVLVTNMFGVLMALALFFSFNIGENSCECLKINSFFFIWVLRPVKIISLILSRVNR